MSKLLFGFRPDVCTGADFAQVRHECLSWFGRIRATRARFDTVVATFCDELVAANAALELGLLLFHSFLRNVWQIHDPLQQSHSIDGIRGRRLDIRLLRDVEVGVPQGLLDVFIRYPSRCILVDKPRRNACQPCQLSTNGICSTKLHVS